MFHVVIPARHASTRLPGKPLLMLAGKPMLQWVHESARRSRAATIVIATDDERIARAAREFGADVQLTAATHASGTDRIAEVARSRAWGAEDVVVNLQGDEPLMPHVLVDQVAALLLDHDDDDMATLAGPLADVAAFRDPNVVKLVADRHGRALYFSRAPIPCNRDGDGGDPAAAVGARRHIGLYAYRVRVLRKLAALPATPLEQLEQLEQLRALENGLAIRVADAAVAPGQDVNTAADLERVAGMLGA